jgi:hypothetical protein
VTINLAKDVPDPLHDEREVKTCGEYISSDFDQCIDGAVSKEMGRLFNCSLPFLRPNKKIQECRLDAITEIERKHILDAFTG